MGESLDIEFDVKSGSYTLNINDSYYNYYFGIENMIELKNYLDKTISEYEKR